MALFKTKEDMKKMELRNRILWGIFVVAIAATMVYAYTFTLVGGTRMRTCSDNDGGLNARVNGSINGTQLGGVHYKYDDFCKTSKILYERACNFDGTETKAQTWWTNCNNVTESTTKCLRNRCI